MDRLNAVRCLVEEKCRHLEFETFELAKVFGDDHFVNAFLEDNKGDTDKTVILKALTYRKKFKVYKVSASDLPMEMFAWNSRIGSDIYDSDIFQDLSPTMTDVKLQAVRRLVGEECRHFEFEAFELERVYRDDQYVEAFSEDSGGDTKGTVAAILKALSYRKKYQVFKIKDSDLPMEIFAWNSREGSDICGKKVMWMTVGCYRNMPELVDVTVMVNFKHLGGHFESHEKIDTYVDLRCMSANSVDTRLSRKLSSMVTTCFPAMFDHMYICGLPVTLTAIVQAMVKLLPARYLDKASFITVEEAKARVRLLQPLVQPKGSNIRQVLTKQNVPEARIDKLVETFTSARQMSDRLFEQLGV